MKLVVDHCLIEVVCLKAQPCSFNWRSIVSHRIVIGSNRFKRLPQQWLTCFGHTQKCSLQFRQLTYFSIITSTRAIAKNLKLRELLRAIDAQRVTMVKSTVNASTPSGGFRVRLSIR